MAQVPGGTRRVRRQDYEQNLRIGTPPDRDNAGSFLGTLPKRIAPSKYGISEEIAVAAPSLDFFALLQPPNLAAARAFNSFLKNKDKIANLQREYPDVKIITIDNSGNQNRECSIEEALNWSYELTDEQKDELIKLIENDTELSEERKQQLLAGFESDKSNNITRTPSNNRQDQQVDRGGQGFDGRRTSDEIQYPSERLGLDEQDGSDLFDSKDEKGNTVTVIGFSETRNNPEDSKQGTSRQDEASQALKEATNKNGRRDQRVRQAQMKDRQAMIAAPIEVKRGVVDPINGTVTDIDPMNWSLEENTSAFSWVGWRAPYNTPIF